MTPAISASEARKSLFPLIERVNALIVDIKQDPEGAGIGKPELLRNNLAGLQARRIDDEHRLVYALAPDELTIIACRYRYE